jgi:hypothetical protein
MVPIMRIVHSEPAEDAKLSSVSPVTSSNHQSQVTSPPAVSAVAMNPLAFGDWATWCLLCTLILGVLLLGISLS